MNPEYTIPQNQIERLPVIFSKNKYNTGDICPLVLSEKCPNILCNECKLSQDTFQRVSDNLIKAAERRGFQVRPLQIDILESKSRGLTFEFSKGRVIKTISLTQTGGVANGYWIIRSTTSKF